MSLALYFDPISSPCRATLALLKLSKIPHEENFVSLAEQQNRSGEYLKINPRGLVPVLDDNGFIVQEHEAILRYLAKTRPEAQEYYPDDVKTQALIDQYYPFHYSEMIPKLLHYFYGYNHFPQAGAFNKEEARKGVNEALKKFDEIYLQDKKYLAGNKITIADLTAVNQIFQVYFMADIDLKEFPRVKAYVDRSLENPVLLEVSQPLREIAKKLRGNSQ